MREGALATVPVPGVTREIALAAAALVLFIALPFAASAAGHPALVTLATRALIFGIAAASLNFILGYGGMVSFGHAAFFGLGGYTVGILYQHASQGDLFLGFIPGSDQLLVTLPAAMAVAGLGPALIGALSLRTSGVQFIMITLAFAQMLFFLFVPLKMYGGDDGLMIRRADALPGLNMRDKQTFYYVCLALSAASILPLDEVVHVIVKPPGAWKGTSAESLLDLERLPERAVFFAGSAREAAAAFPQNANVAVISALAGIGLDRTRIELVADPDTTRNAHHIRASGGFGRLALLFENEPLKTNPKSSEMTALSLVRVIENQFAPLAR